MVDLVNGLAPRTAAIVRGGTARLHDSVALRLVHLSVLFAVAVLVGAEALTAVLQGHVHRVTASGAAEFEGVGVGIVAIAHHGAQVASTIVNEATNELGFARHFVDDHGRSAAVLREVPVPAATLVDVRALRSRAVVVGQLGFSRRTVFR
jgi:hypothetical protein